MILGYFGDCDICRVSASAPDCTTNKIASDRPNLVGSTSLYRKKLRAGKSDILPSFPTTIAEIGVPLVQGVSQIANPRKHNKAESTTRTLRLESELDEGLSKLAEKDNISVNLLINKALTRYVEWDANSEKFGLVSVSKRLLRTLFEYLPEKEVRDLGTRSGKEGGPEMVTFFYKKFDLDSLLKAFENLTSKYANHFKFEHHFEGKTHTLVMKHDTGLKASAYYAESVKAVFALLGLKAKTTETEAQVVATVNVD